MTKTATIIKAKADDLPPKKVVTPVKNKSLLDRIVKSPDSVIGHRSRLHRTVEETIDFIAEKTNHPEKVKDLVIVETGRYLWHVVENNKIRIYFADVDDTSDMVALADTIRNEGNPVYQQELFGFIRQCTIWEADKIPGGWTPPTEEGAIITFRRAKSHGFFLGQPQFSALEKNIQVG